VFSTGLGPNVGVGICGIPRIDCPIRRHKFGWVIAQSPARRSVLEIKRTDPGKLNPVAIENRASRNQGPVDHGQEKGTGVVLWRPRPGSQRDRKSVGLVAGLVAPIGRGAADSRRKLIQIESSALIPFTLHKPSKHRQKQFPMWRLRDFSLVVTRSAFTGYQRTGRPTSPPESVAQARPSPNNRKPVKTVNFPPWRPRFGASWFGVLLVAITCPQGILKTLHGRPYRRAICTRSGVTPSLVIYEGTRQAVTCPADTGASSATNAQKWHTTHWGCRPLARPGSSTAVLLRSCHGIAAANARGASELVPPTIYIPSRMGAIVLVASEPSASVWRYGPFSKKRRGGSVGESVTVHEIFPMMHPRRAINCRQAVSCSSTRSLQKQPSEYRARRSAPRRASIKKEDPLRGVDFNIHLHRAEKLDLDIMQGSDPIEMRAAGPPALPLKFVIIPGSLLVQWWAAHAKPGGRP